MHEVTRTLTEHVLRYQSSVNMAAPPSFAFMMSFQEAREFWQDLIVAKGGFEVNYYTNMWSSEPQSRVHVAYDILEPPPFPSKDHNVWCKFHGPGGDEITIIIKGMKDE